MQTNSIDTAGRFEVSVKVQPDSRVKTHMPSESLRNELQADSQDLAKLQLQLAPHDISLEFSKDEATNQIVVQMIDQRTGEAVRQFPTAVSLSLAANFLKLQGIFLNVTK